MNFTIFRDFSDFIFYLKTFKINKKNYKKDLIIARVPRGCNVARKATWQSHADPRSAYVAHYTYSIFYYYKMGLQPSLYGKGY